jgi:hypothetical protein
MYEEQILAKNGEDLIKQRGGLELSRTRFEPASFKDCLASCSDE